MNGKPPVTFGLGMAFGVLLLVIAALFAGLLPLSMPMGFAAGGVLETGQVEPARWWIGVAVAVGLYGLFTWNVRVRIRLWWLAILGVAIASAIALFCHRASEGQARAADQPVRLLSAPAPKIGIITALPLFWAEARAPGDLIAPDGAQEESGPGHAFAAQMGAHPVDRIDGSALAGIGTLIVAQPRLLQPAELAALDSWIRAGGKAIILADPLLIWPSALPLGDPRRAPLTSLLDPLLAHWGVRLMHVSDGREGVERRMLSTGHALILAGASRFTVVPNERGQRPCMLAEGGLMARCRIGKGRVRLIADADLLDDRLWLADADFTARPEAQASDIVPLMRAWARDPAAPRLQAAPRRVTDETALVEAMRRAIWAGILWVGLGWLGQRRFFRPGWRLRPGKAQEDG